jgi:hypothetical protein
MKRERVYIKCELQQMAQSEILDMIPSETLQRIRDTDPHPEFRVFSVGHEGAANATVLGVGMKILNYARDIIVQMFNRLRLGLPAFNRHQPQTNSHVNRDSVGEVVGKTIQKISGVLHTLAAVYIKPEYRSVDLDIASLEGNFEAEENSDGSMGVVSLSNITGLALSNHKVDTPAMPGATLQAALQMFTQKTGRMHQMEEFTKEQIKEAILKMRLSPADIFSEEEIISSDPARKAKQTEYEHVKRLEKRLGEAREENSKLQGEFSKIQDENKQLAIKANAGVVRDVFTSIAREKKLDQKFVQYVNKNIPLFKSDKKDAEFKAELEAFVNTQAKEYVEMGKLYGFEAKVTVDGNPADDKSKENETPGTPPTDKKKDGEEEAIENVLEDPKKNDFIPD